MSSRLCAICGGDGEIEVSHQSDEHGVYRRCQYCHGTGRIGSNFVVPDRGYRGGLGVLLIIVVPFVLLVGSAFAVMFFTVLERQPWWPYAWKIGAVVFGICFVWVVARVVAPIIGFVLMSPAWLVSLALGLTLYRYGAYGTGLFTAGWQSAALFCALSLGWPLITQLITQLIAPRIVVLAAAGFVFWSQFHHIRALFP